MSDTAEIPEPLPTTDDLPPEPPFNLVLEERPNSEIKAALNRTIEALSAVHGNILEEYHCLAIYEPDTSVDNVDLNRIFRSLRSKHKKEKDVLLVLLSRGGSIEFAYQISKLCKAYSQTKFVVTIPRFAKSAATLIALGADEIHMGMLGQLGPIDPQLDGLPALGVHQALKTIASVSQDYPGSSEMFASYLRMVLTVEQIGFCDRITESAVQYAERLLLTKPFLQERANEIAKVLVHSYKHHGFVIDLDETRTLLGTEWVKTDTNEIQFSEDLYDLFETSNATLKKRSKKLILVGGLLDGALIISTRRSD